MYVPDASYRDFLALYAECVNDGDQLYVVERPSPRIRFYADFDMHVDAAEVECIVARTAASFARHATKHSNSDSPVVVLRAAPKPIKGGGEGGKCGAGCVKLGLHIVLPMTRVDVSEAERLRGCVLADIIAELPPPHNSWEDAFDASVYRQGGLRLVGSRKMEACTCASGPCPHPLRRVDAGRPYELVNVLTPEGSEDADWTRRLRSNAALLVIMVSIRTPAAPGEEAGVANAHKQRNHASAASHSTGSRGVELRLCDAVVGSLHQKHASLSISRVNERGIARLEGEGARFCPNVDRQHTQSTIYCIASRTTLVLRCHCRKGTCPAYRSQAMPLTQAGAKLFGLLSGGETRGLPLGFV